MAVATTTAPRTEAQRDVLTIMDAHGGESVLSLISHMGANLVCYAAAMALVRAGTLETFQEPGGRPMVRRVPADRLPFDAGPDGRRARADVVPLAGGGVALVVTAHETRMTQAGRMVQVKVEIGPEGTDCLIGEIAAVRVRQDKQESLFD